MSIVDSENDRQKAQKEMKRVRNMNQQSLRETRKCEESHFKWAKRVAETTLERF